MVKNKIKAYIRSTYPHNYPLLAFVFLGVAMGENPTIFLVIKALFYTFLIFSATMILNVIMDWDYDRLHGKNEFIHDHLSKKDLAILYFIFVITSFILAILSNYNLMLAMVSSIILGVLYSLDQIRLKDKYMLNYLTIAAGYGLAFPLIGFFSTDPSGELTQLRITVLSISFLFCFFSSQIKDFEEITSTKKQSTLAHSFINAPLIFVFYHIFLFSLIAILIYIRILSPKFIIVFVLLPVFAAFLQRFLKAKTEKEYRLLHEEHHSLTFSFVLTLILSYIL